MNKKVIGVYNTEEELVAAVERLQRDGHSLSDLSILGNTSESMSHLGNLTGISEEAIHQGDTNKGRGFFDTLASAFDGSENSSENSYYDRLVGFGVNESEAREYSGDIESGRYVLLSEKGGFSGTSNYKDSTLDSSFDSTLDSDSDDQRTLRLREERLDVNKERIQTGEVEVHKNVVEEQKTINVPVTHEEVYVERRSVNETDTGNTPIGDDETIRVPIVEEKLEVNKRPVVSEELVIGKREVQSTEQVVENVKHEEAQVESDGEIDINEKRNSKY